MVDRLSVEVAGLKLRNPTILAAGILGVSGDLLVKVWKSGAGAVTTKSLGLEPRIGYPNPTVIQLDYGLLNAVGLANPGIHEFAQEMEKVKSSNATLVVSVYGFSPREYREVAGAAEDYGADAVELNVSCPHVERLGSEVGQNPKLLREVVAEVKSTLKIPVFVKLTPNVSDIVEVARAAVDAGADALTAINTVKAMAIDVETMYPILGNRFGGLSGPAIKPIAVRCVYELFEEFSIPLIGCGGILDWRDAVEFMLAGASAVQVGSGIMVKDLGIFSSIVEGINLYLESKGFSRVDEIVGLSHRR
ncbi:dihydroorotate dehydrogenase [Candidatus Bathyarchaeota archaeon]|nr:dihydroorotate dehydrogenase [Candidatus Bathyarchaeota archaeon]